MATDFNTEPDIPLSQIPGYSEVADIVAGRKLCNFRDVNSFYFLRHDERAWEELPDIFLVMQDGDQPLRKIGFRFHGPRDAQFSAGTVSVVYISKA